MAAENIGNLVPTKIPGYSDSADIQAALRVYHYGSYSYDTTNTNTANLVNPSIAYTINDLQDQIDAIDPGIQTSAFTAKGSLLTATASNTPSELTVGTNGHVLTANSAVANGIEWALPAVTAANTLTFTGKTISLSTNTISGTIAQFNTALTDGDFATLAGTETLTNKTLNLTNNSLSGTVAEFNTALSDGDFATIAGSETLTNKTLTSPTINTPTISTATFNGTTTFNGSSLVFEGATADANETTINVTDPTSDRTITIPDGSGTIAFRELEFNTTSSTSYTFGLSDSGKMIIATANTSATFSVPTNAVAAFPIGTTINIIGTGTGSFKIQAVSSGTTTVVSAGNTPTQPTLRTQYSSATLIKASTDLWYVVGDIT